ncbi:type III-B CRISPR module RAMP protein Cmr4 [Desulfovibrio sp.]
MSIYFAVTLDPLHIGAGGYRLGRVDNTIVRDAGSGLPKVPGSSLAGVARSYLLQALEGEEQEKIRACAASTGNDKGNCGRCLACRLFGYAASGKQARSHIGLLRFYDGEILAFPVSTIAGPVWVTSPAALAYVLPASELPEAREDVLLVDGFDPGKRLNAGWLYLEARQAGEALRPLRDKLGAEASRRFSRLALAPDWLFAELVNSNLEVRTSVSIDPLTGAAEAGKLFTYEAIPAATLLAFDIALDEARCAHAHDADGPNPVDAVRARHLLDEALSLCAVLGMGGMVTRGFGRIRFWGGA